jgi:hypothetical protein
MTRRGQVLNVRFQELKPTLVDGSSRPAFFAQYDAQAADAMSLSMGQLISSEAIEQSVPACAA